MGELGKVYKNFKEYAEDKQKKEHSADWFISQQAWEACATSKDHEYCNKFYSIGGALAKLKKILSNQLHNDVGDFFNLNRLEFEEIMKLIAIIERSQDENINP